MILKPHFVDVEVDVSLLEIRRMGLPGDGLRIACLNGKLGFVAEAMPMLADLAEKQVERVVLGLFVDGHNGAATFLPAESMRGTTAPGALMALSRSSSSGIGPSGSSPYSSITAMAKAS